MKRQSYSPKAIVETGIMFVIIMLITLITTTIPALIFMGMFILPIPIILLCIRYDYKVAFTGVVMSIILTGLFLGPIKALTYGISYGLTGIIFAYCIKNEKKNTVTEFIVSGSIFVGNIITYLIYALFIGKQGVLNTLNYSIDKLRQMYIDINSIYIQQNGPSDVSNKINQIIDLINVKNVLIVLPIILIVNSLIQGYLSQIITYKILVRLKINMRRPTSFSEIYISNRIIALSIIITCLGVILRSRGFMWAVYVRYIFEYLSITLLIIDGIGYLTHKLRRKYKVSKELTIIILIIGFIMPIFQQLYLVLGSADVLLNLRGLDPDPIRKVKSRE